MRFSIGQLRHRVTIQSLVSNPDTGHSVDETYQDIAQAWAKMETLQGVELFDNKQNAFSPTHRFTIRHMDGVTSERWILYDSRRFRIRSVRNYLERGRFLILESEEAFSAGAYA